eukprot:scaffold6431_cov139-Skeletonema_menzelii.AAC.8
MAEDIAREIIAQSKGGGKLAFKLSLEQGSISDSSLILSLSNSADQKEIYHIHLIRDGKTYEIIYSGLGKACDFIKSVLGHVRIRVKLVLYKKNISECITLSTIYSSCHTDSLSFHIKNNMHLLDVVDVVEG